MAQAQLTIDLDAIRANWRALAARGTAEAGAVVKANCYGLGADRVAPMLAREGVRRFFVATTEEGASLRHILGAGPEINVFSGHMTGDAALLRDAHLTPMINSIDQMLRHVEALPGHPFGIQLDSGMNRLGMEPAEWSALRDIALAQNPRLVMSHLACADEPDHGMNAFQLRTFREMTDGIEAPRSLAATGGILLGEAYHFDVTRPGIGLYGGLPFAAAQRVVALDIPIIQVRDVTAGESVGYGNAFVARMPMKVATIAAGYADGLIRALAPKTHLWAGDTRCKLLGRISMDLITVDVSAVREMPATLELLGPHQGVDQLADHINSIGYEILTSLGSRYARRYLGG
ncbi:alanine racemase [Salipiger marinus]|jgi:alanine racemase|uniref:Alanine racemase n=1 Tax=Salipiger marinus TaxID=555512 RepID=A0A1G8JEW0_9RHOB|nr:MULTISPECIES: alanine racemase [Salipiger]MCD1620058.1 alanine racemase [Salipiger manganoxidans]MEB3420402.1 alanine racemase [Salipiger manganoxidans]SDI29814.1 alanine racemase [Salipiger marinus]HBM59129.1 alanine racemase [Citreicella sp.]